MVFIDAVKLKSLNDFVKQIHGKICSRKIQARFVALIKVGPVIGCFSEQ